MRSMYFRPSNPLPAKLYGTVLIIVILLLRWFMHR